MPRRQGNARPWIKKAEHDYEAAKILARMRTKLVPDAVCFHAQQSAEKYLKALLVLHRIYFRKTHDLLELLSSAAKIEPTLELLRPFLELLQPYAVEFRYPDEFATPNEARQAMRALRRIRERLRHVLGLSVQP